MDIMNANPPGLLSWDLYQELGTVVVIPTSATHSPSDVDDWSNKKFRQRFASLPPVIHDPKVGIRKVYHLTEHTVFKPFCRSSEARTLQLVSEQTFIPVPHVRRVLEGCEYAMEYIPGTPLTDVWPTLSWPDRVKMALTIRSYIQQLHAISHPRSSIPGPLGEGTVAKLSDSPVWGAMRSSRGPFDSYAALRECFDQRVVIAAATHKQDNAMLRRMGCDVPENPDTSYADVAFDDSEPLVFCHMDICPQNFIVGEDGTLWLLSFGMSGFWPPWFEFVVASMQSEWGWKSGNIQSEKDWVTLIPLMCGWYHKQYSWYNDMSRAFDRR